MNSSVIHMSSDDCMRGNASMNETMKKMMLSYASQNVSSLPTSDFDSAQNLSQLVNVSGQIVARTAGVSEVSITHLLGWLMLFCAIAAAAVVLMNTYLHHRQVLAEEARVQEQMRATAAANSPHAAVDLGAGDERSLSSLRSEGNSSRQRFLAARRAAAQKNYGAVDDPELL